MLLGPVRDPVSMIVSAYCYHHRGKEPGNIMFPSDLMMSLGPKEGLIFVAERMLQMVENMTGVFEHPSNDTFRLDFEKVTSSPELFDQEMEKVVDFLFKGPHNTR